MNITMTSSLANAIVAACNKEHGTNLTMLDITNLVLGSSYLMVNDYLVSWESVNLHNY